MAVYNLRRVGCGENTDTWQPYADFRYEAPVIRFV